MLQENTVAPGGRHVEILGSLNPHSKETTLNIDRIKYWIGKGATTSDTVHNLLVKKGVISEKKRVVKLPKKAVVAEASVSNPAYAEAPAGKQEAANSEPISAEASAGKQEEGKKEEVVVEKKKEEVVVPEVVTEKKEESPVEKIEEPKVE
jgi:ribosomal protein S16